MKKVLIILLVLIGSAALVGCQHNRSDTIRVGVSFYPAADILELVRDELEAEGIFLDIVVFSDFSPTNPALAANELDANFIQHRPFMEMFNQTTNSELVIAKPIYHARFNIYSGQFASLDEITPETTVVLIDDRVNLARSLLLLQSAGLIEVRSNIVFEASLDDIISNPLNLNFELVPQLIGPLRYEELNRSLAIMYPTFARNIGLSGDDEIIFSEELNEITKEYAISLVSRANNLDSHNIQRLIHHLNSHIVYDWIIQNYGWAAIPAFTVS